nr:hypothetical protein [Rhodopirellula sp. SM50]
MIPALIAQPITSESETQHPPPKRIARKRTLQNTRTLRTAKILDDSIGEEEACILKLIAWFVVLLILPAILTLLYVSLNPDAFMINIAPEIDFSTWRPGQRP